MTFIFYFLSAVIFLNVSVQASQQLPFEAEGERAGLGKNTLTNLAKQGNQMMPPTNPIKIDSTSGENKNQVIMASARPPTQSQMYMSGSGEIPSQYQQMEYPNYNQPSSYYQQPPFGQQPYYDNVLQPSQQGIYNYLPSIPNIANIPSFPSIPSFFQSFPSLEFPFSNYLPPNLERLIRYPFDGMQVQQETHYDDGKLKAHAQLYGTDPNNPNVKGTGFSASTSYQSATKTNPDGTTVDMTSKEANDFQQRMQNRMSQFVNQFPRLGLL